jgi:hypothetical protein
MRRPTRARIRRALACLVLAAVALFVARTTARDASSLAASGPAAVAAMAAMAATGVARAPVPRTGATHSIAAPTTVSTPASPPPKPDSAARAQQIAQHARRAGERMARDGITRERVEARRPPVSRRRIEALHASGALVATGAAREIAGVRHQPVRLHKDGLPVLNRSLRLHEQDGASLRPTGVWTVPLPEIAPPGETLWKIPADEAIARAERHFGIRTRRAVPRVERGWWARPGGTVACWRITIAAAAPLGTFQVAVNARSGEVMAAGDVLRNELGVGLVYYPNRVLGPTPIELTLFDLDASGRLSGRIARVLDDRNLEAYRPDRYFLFAGENDPRFVQTAVFRSLTDTARYAEASGFPTFTSPLIALVNLADPLTGGEYNNAFYDPYLQIFGFGDGDGVLTANLGTDADVAAHEMGHHFVQTLVDPEVTSFDPLLGAIHEGVADTFGALLGGGPAIGESTLPGQPYLRTLANTASYPDGGSEDPHVEGLIYGGANWDLILRVGGQPFTQILLAALPFLAAEPELPTEYRDALIAGDQAVTGGLNRTVIRELFSLRGFDGFDDIADFSVLDDGVAYDGYLADGEFALFVFYEFPGSSRLDVRTTGTGDVDLYVTAASLDPGDPSSYLSSETYTSYESIVVASYTTPSIHVDDTWVVVVQDFEDGAGSTYRVTATQTLPAAGITIGGIPFYGDLAQRGEIDFVTFYSNAGQIVRLEAHAQTPSLDPLVAIFNPKDIGVLAADDDSGPELDALIQGVRIPASGSYGIAVLSPAADVDPSVGTGDYRLTLSSCSNTGADPDGDGLADACDDDDDDDGFKDADDDAPSDTLRCLDSDQDGCDDCVSGTWSFFDDGPDADGDGYCDGGDDDDDNDGCADDVDASPLSPSVDPDYDFRGVECDNCPVDANAGQEDQDGDGLGDVCDPTPTPEPHAGALAALAALAALRSRLRRFALAARAPTRTRSAAPRSR